jgi:Chemoreceptor zinc-binding domain
MDLDQAIRKHSDWKIKFRSAISKQESMDAETIAKDNCCDLGKWLHGDAKRDFAAVASLSECVTMHAAFHVEAGKVASAINAKKFTAAETMIDPNSPYARASSAVVKAILKLKAEVAVT